MQEVKLYTKCSKCWGQSKSWQPNPRGALLTRAGLHAGALLISCEQHLLSSQLLLCPRGAVHYVAISLLIKMNKYRKLIALGVSTCITESTFRCSAHSALFQSVTPKPGEFYWGSQASPLSWVKKKTLVLMHASEGRGRISSDYSTGWIQQSNAQITPFIIHQIFSLAHDWWKRDTWPNNYITVHISSPKVVWTPKFEHLELAPQINNYTEKNMKSQLRH